MASHFYSENDYFNLDRSFLFIHSDLFLYLMLDSIHHAFKPPSTECEKPTNKRTKPPRLDLKIFCIER